MQASKKRRPLLLVARPRARPRYGIAAATLLLVGIARPASPASPPASQALLLEVIVNGRRIGKIGEFQSRDGALFATRRELGELGLQTSAGNADDLIALGSLAGVTERFDQTSQTIAFDAATASMRPALLGPEQAEHDDIPIETGVGAVVNYDAAAAYAAGRSRVDVLLDGRLFSPWGVGSTQVLTRTGVGSTRAIRLDSTYTYSDAETLQRVRVGDVISSGLAWSRPLRLGGAQFARDFGLRPDLITFPVPSISGQVAVPSTVDVLINGTQLLSTQAEPGPFELRQLPIVNGVNEVALVVNNQLGQQVTRTVPIYTSSALLAPGLDAYSIEAGAVRLGFGINGSDYRQPAVSASYRRGLTDWLTVSGHGEASPSFGMAGGGMTAALGSFAVASAAVAGSGAQGKSGLLAYGSVERITRKISLSASAQWTDGRFRDLASLYDDPVPSRAIRASAGYSLGTAGTVGIAYTRQRRSTVARPYQLQTGTTSFGGPLSTDPLTGPTFYLPVRTSLVTVSYSVSLGFASASFYATAFHDFENRSSNGALFGITMPLGDRNSVGFGAGMTANAVTGSVQASRPVIAVGDTGGQLYASAGGDRRVLATGQYKSPWSLLEVSGFHSSGQTAWRGGARGAIVIADNHLFASNLIPDSFAVVNTGSAGVDVLYENRPVQRTGADGRVLVPDLRSFEVNRVSVDTNALPLDVDVGSGTQFVRPADRSGVVLHFDTRKTQSALLRVVDDGGRPLPLGTTLRLEGSGEPVPVGYDGQAFVRDLPPHVRIKADVPGQGACWVTFDYRPTAGDIPTVGPLRCRKSP